MNETAKTFLTRCFAPGETIALLLRTEIPAKTQQRVVTLERALAPRYLGWLAHENHNGANVYVAAESVASWQPQTHESKRGIGSISSIDIDKNGDVRLAALRASDALPVPSVVLSTSPNKISGALARRWLRLCDTGNHAQAARIRLRRRPRLHRLQPGTSYPRFPESEVFTRLLGCGRIPL